MLYSCMTLNININQELRWGIKYYTVCCAEKNNQLLRKASMLNVLLKVFNFKSRHMHLVNIGIIILL